MPVWRSSNLVFTIWAVFGGFILHFLLSNFLTVLLRPSFEEPVETAKDIIDRNIIPFAEPGERGEFYKQFFENSPNEHYQKLSQNFFLPKSCKHEKYYKKFAEDDCGFGGYSYKVAQATITGEYATFGFDLPEVTFYNPKRGYLNKGDLIQQSKLYRTYPSFLNQWYMSSETIGGLNPYMVHLLNKKWPLKKVNRGILNFVEQFWL